MSDFDDLVGDVDNVSTSQESNEHSKFVYVFSLFTRSPNDQAVK